VGWSDVVLAPPNLKSPFPEVTEVQLPENVPTLLTPRVEQKFDELKSWIIAPVFDGGPCTNGGEMYAVAPSPAAAMATSGVTVSNVARLLRAIAPVMATASPRRWARRSDGMSISLVTVMRIVVTDGLYY
jgi:hypothetical protein